MIWDKVWCNFIAGVSWLTLEIGPYIDLHFIFGYVKLIVVKGVKYGRIVEDRAFEIYPN